VPVRSGQADRPSATATAEATAAARTGSHGAVRGVTVADGEEETEVCVMPPRSGLR
jgi:hypothetical protein